MKYVVKSYRLPVYWRIAGKWSGHTHNCSRFGYTWQRLDDGRSRWCQLTVRVFFKAAVYPRRVDISW